METDSLTMNINFTQMSSEISLSSNVSDNDCIIYRFISTIFISISIILFAFNIRFILIDRHRLNPLALNLIVNSMLITFLSLPYILIQLIKCSPVQSYFICCLEGLTCFTCGVCVMYTMCLLACVQYVRLFYNTTILYRIIEHKNSFLIPFLCWFIAFLWSLPPFMNINPGFNREGKGFHCSLNWIKSDVSSRLYLFLAFIWLYFFPLFCLLYTHIRIIITIRQLVYRQYPLISKSAKTMSADMRHRLIDTFTVAESNRRKHLRIDRRFAKATMITVLYYSVVWTPYTLCGIIQMTLAVKNMHYQLPSMLITASALISKLAVIGQSCVYFYTVRPSNRRFSLTSAAFK